MESARIQATNRMKRLSDDQFSFDYNTIMNLPNTGYSHSVLNGAFAAAACIASNVLFFTHVPLTVLRNVQVGTAQFLKVSHMQLQSHFVSQ